MTCYPVCPVYIPAQGWPCSRLQDNGLSWWSPKIAVRGVECHWMNLGFVWVWVAEIDVTVVFGILNAQCCCEMSVTVYWSQ